MFQTNKTTTPNITQIQVHQLFKKFSAIANYLFVQKDANLILNVLCFN